MVMVVTLPSIFCQRTATFTIDGYIQWMNDGNSLESYTSELVAYSRLHDLPLVLFLYPDLFLEATLWGYLYLPVEALKVY